LSRQKREKEEKKVSVNIPLLKKGRGRRSKKRSSVTHTTRWEEKKKKNATPIREKERG